MMTAIETYKKNFTPPEWALKDINGGRLKGMSDINPQWRIEALTETFGLCGIGWRYEIEKAWIEQGGTVEISAFAKVNLYIKIKDEWSSPIPAIGGSSFIASEKNGPYQSDECYKMAITDALSVCCKMLGIGGKIYLGSKYDKFKKEEDDRIKLQNKELQLSIDEMLKCETLYQVKELWANTKKYQLKPEFESAKDQMKIKLTPKPT